MHGLAEEAKKQGLDVSEFTREMIETTNDKKVIEATAAKEKSQIEYLGLLIFGNKNIVDSLTKDSSLYT